MDGHDGSGNTLHQNGTVVSNCNSMSGTWLQSDGQGTTWTATRRTSTTPTPVTPTNTPVTPTKTPVTPTPTNTPVTPTKTPVTPTPTNTPMPGQFKISGQILNGLNIGIDGVVVTFGGKSATTDNAGKYSVTGLSNGSYSPSLSKTGYTFSNFPGSITVQNGDKSMNAVGHYTAATVDSGFKPNPNGFSFSNFSYTGETWDIFKRTFPNSKMENSDGSRKQAADQFYKNVYWNIGNGGNCRGFSHASLIRYAGLSGLETVEKAVLKSPNNTVTNSYDMIPRLNGSVVPNQSDSKDYLHIYQGRQLSQNFRPFVGTPNYVLQLVKDALADFKDNAADVAIFSSAGGHSIVPYRVEKVGNIDRIYVYDNNHPNNNNKYIEIDTAANRYTYNVWGSTIWKGTGNSMYVGLAQQNFPATIAGARQRQDVVTLNETSLMVTGDVTPLVVDAAGNKLGLIGGEMVSEIPDAIVKILPNFNPDNPDAPLAVIYQLPLTTSYTLQAYAENSGVYSVTTFAEGLTTALNGVEAASGSTDEIQVSAGMRQLTLTATGQNKDYCYFFGDDTLTDASRSFEICTTTSAGGQATFGVAIDNNSFTFENNGQAADYDLIVTQTGQNSMVKTFTGQVSGNNQVTISLTSNKVYLPLLVK